VVHDARPQPEASAHGGVADVGAAIALERDQEPFVPRIEPSLEPFPIPTRLHRDVAEANDRQLHRRQALEVIARVDLLGERRGAGEILLDRRTVTGVGGEVVAYIW